MSGDDEDRLDFGEDEELEDQISLGDAGDTEAAGGFRQQQPQALNDNMDADERLNGTGHAQAAASEEQPLEGSDSEEPLPPGWVTRRSRQGELYYFHEATTESQWDRPTMTSVVVAESIQVTSNDVKSTPAAPAASTSQDTSKSAYDPAEGASEGTSASKWGRQTQPRQEQAFTSRKAGPEAFDKPKSAREVAAAAADKQSEPSSGGSRAPPREATEVAKSSASGRDSPSIPTGPRSARAPPTGPRNTQQEQPRWPARDTQYKQSSGPSIPTGPSADRSRIREGPPSSRPVDRDMNGSTSGPRATRGDAGWPTRDPVGPPADLDRASSSGFRPPASRDLPPAPRGRDYEDDRRPSRTEPPYRERDVEQSFRDFPPSRRDARGPVRDPRDEGWSRRPPPQDDYYSDERAPRRREPSPPPRRALSPPSARREAPLPDRRPRSPLPARPVRDLPEPPYRAPAREFPEDRFPRQGRRSPSPPPVRRRRSPSPLPFRRKRSPSPPPMRKWAVRTITPPAAEDPIVTRLDDSAAALPARPSDDVNDRRPALAGKERSGDSRPATVPVAQEKQDTEEPARSAASQPATVAKPVEEAAPVFPRPREKRVISPGLASRLDQPLSQPPVKDTRRRAGRTPPPPVARPARRSPSPDSQRKRPAQGGSSLVDRMGGGQPSLLSRMVEGGDRNGGRPVKRSKREDYPRDSRDNGAMDVDASADLARRLTGSRSRSRSPPPDRGEDRGIAIFGASRGNGPDGSDRAEDRSRNDVEQNLPIDRVTLQESSGSKEGISFLRRADSSAQRSRERSPRLVGEEVKTQPETSQKSSSSINISASNGLPPRPSGFASLPPRPSTIIPPPDMRPPSARGGSSTPNPALLDSYRPGPPERRHSSRGPPPADPYYPPSPAKEAPILDRYVPRRAPVPGKPSRPRSPPPSRDYPRRDYR